MNLCISSDACFGGFFLLLDSVFTSLTPFSCGISVFSLLIFRDSLGILQEFSLRKYSLVWESTKIFSCHLYVNFDHGALHWTELLNLDAIPIASFYLMSYAFEVSFQRSYPCPPHVTEIFSYIIIFLICNFAFSSLMDLEPPFYV